METYQQFLARVGLEYSEQNLVDPEWVKKFWNAIRTEKVARQDYNFIGFIFPYFDVSNFHTQHGNNRLEFNERVDFQMAQFRGRANFSSMTFHNLAVFSGADFYEDTTFSHPWFMEEVQFDNCNFRKGLQFVGQFLKKCHFRGARFSSEHKTVFSPIGYSEIFKDTAHFSNIIFPETFTFLYCDLSNVSFAGSYLRKLDFVGCTFQEKNDRYLIYDEEKTFRDWGKGIDTRHFLFLENLYRQLKGNFDEKTDWNMADRFYVSEMESRRQRIWFEVMGYSIPSNIYYQTSWDYQKDWKKRVRHYIKLPDWQNVYSQLPHLFLFYLFKLVSNYGHSIHRALLSLLILVGSGALFLACKEHMYLTTAIAKVLQGIITQNYSTWKLTIMNLTAVAILLPIILLVIKRQFRR